jgi:multidrug efflux system membrane fusion protein
MGTRALRAAAEPAGHAAIRVETAAVQRRDVADLSGRSGDGAKRFYTVTMTARVDGQIQKIGFTEGQTVAKGSLIAQIDPRPYQAALDQALAVKAKDEATLQSAKADLERYVELAPPGIDE